MDRTQSAGLRHRIAECREIVARMRLDKLSLRTAFVVQAVLASVLLVSDLSNQTLAGSLPTLIGAVAFLSIGYLVIASHAEPGILRQSFARDGAAGTIDREQLDHLKEQVCHELRTPLNAVIGFSEMMQRELLGPVGNERYREYAGHIRDSAEQFHSATEKTLTAATLLAAPTRGPRERFRLCDSLDGDVVRRNCLDVSIEIEGCRKAIVGGLEHLIAAAGALTGGDGDRVTLTASPNHTSSADQAGTISLEIVALGAADAPLVRGNGFDLALLLARLHLAAGSIAIVDTWRADGCWSATISLPIGQSR